MASNECMKKMESLQQYLPFLSSTIAHLQQPNQKKQLDKITSLHAIITEKKKLKLDTLNKCEEAILRLMNKKKSGSLFIKSEISSPESPPGETCVMSRALYQSIKQENQSKSREETESMAHQSELAKKSDENPLPPKFSRPIHTTATTNKVINHCAPIPTYNNVPTIGSSAEELPPNLSPQRGRSNYDMPRPSRPPTLSPMIHQRRDSRTKSTSSLFLTYRRERWESKNRSPDRHRRRSKTRSPSRYRRRSRSRRSKSTNRHRRSRSKSRKRPFHSRALSRSRSPLPSSKRYRRHSKSPERGRSDVRSISTLSHRSRRSHRSKTPPGKRSSPSVRPSKSIDKDRTKSKSVEEPKSYTPRVEKPQPQDEPAESYTPKIPREPQVSEPLVKDTTKKPPPQTNGTNGNTSPDELQIISNFLRKMLEDERYRDAASMLIENVSKSQDDEDDELRFVVQSFKCESEEEVISKRHKSNKRPIIETDEESEEETTSRPTRVRNIKSELDLLQEDLNRMFNNEDLLNITTRRKCRFRDENRSENFDCKDPNNFELLKYMMSAKVYIARDFSTAGPRERSHYKGRYALRELGTSYVDSEEPRGFEKERERYTLRRSKPMYVYTEFSSDEDTEENGNGKSGRNVTHRTPKIEPREKDETVVNLQPSQGNKSNPSKRMTRWDVGPQKQIPEEVENQDFKTRVDPQPSQQNKKIRPSSNGMSRWDVGPQQQIQQKKTEEDKRPSPSTGVRQKLGEVKPPQETKKSSQKITTPNTKKSPRKKRGHGWAYGILPKFKVKRKNQFATQKTVTAKTQSVAVKTQPRVATGTRRLKKCYLCENSVRNLHVHYRIKHPNVPVPTSRLKPERAEEAIKESVTLKLDEWKDFSFRMGNSYRFKCRFCDSEIVGGNKKFYNHVTSHTAEYRVNCHLCLWGEVEPKSVHLHYQNQHKCKSPNPIPNLPVTERVSGFICTECYYVQINRKTIEDHVKNCHFGDSKMVRRIYLGSLSDKDMKMWHFSKNETSENEAEAKPCPLSVENKLDKSEEPSKKVETCPPPEKDTLIEEGQKSEPPPQKDYACSLSLEQEPPKKVETVLKRKYKACPLSVKQKLAELEETRNEERPVKTMKPNEKENDKVEVKKNVDIPPVTEESSPPPTQTDHKDISPKKPSEHSVQLVNQLKSRLLEDEKCTAKAKNEEEKLANEENENIPAVLSAGFLDVDMSEADIEYVCRLPNCHFHSKDHVIFLDHWTTDHGIMATYKMTTCLLCQSTILVTKNQKLLTKFFNHVESVHLGIIRADNDQNEENSKEDDAPMNINVDSDDESQDTLTEAAEVEEISTDLKKEDDVVPVNKKEDVVVTGDKKEDDIVTIDSDDESRGPLHTEEESAFPIEVNTEKHSNDDFDSESTEAVRIEEPPPQLDKVEEESAFPIEEKHSNDDFDPESTEAVRIKEPPPQLDEVQSETPSKGLVKFDFLVPPNVDSEDNSEPIPNDYNVNFIVSVGILVVVGSPEGFKYMCRVGSCRKRTTVRQKFLDHWKNHHTDIYTTPCMACDGKIIIFECLVEFFHHVEKAHLMKPKPFSFQISEVMSLAEPPPLKIADVCSLAEDPVKPVISTGDFLKAPNLLYKCPFKECYFSTHETSFFINHVKVHPRPKDSLVCCVYCNMKTDISKYISHVDNYHGNCRYSCTSCLYRSVVKEYMIYHIKTQHEGPIKIISLKPLTNQTKLAKKRLTVSQACPPYRCGYDDCGGEFLFQNEYLFHLDNFHVGLGLCGFHSGYSDSQERCDFRNFDKDVMLQHWNIHNVYNFHCLVCSRGTMDLDKMLEHYTLNHFNLEPLVVDRRRAPSAVQFGYTADACSEITYVHDQMLNIVANEPHTIKYFDSTPVDTIEIDSSDEEAPENEPKETDEEKLSEDFLIKKYGRMCLPTDNAFRCPLCLEFTTQKISYFVYHLLVELKCVRYRCSTCDYSCIPFDTMLAHWQDDHNNLVTGNLTEIPLDQNVEFWIELVLKFQAKLIVEHAQVTLGFPSQSTFYNTKCDFCQRWFRNHKRLNDHEICHWAELTFTCNKCSARRTSLDEVFEHVRRKHPGLEYSITANAPSLVIPSWQRFPSKKAVAKPEPTAIRNSEILYGCLQCPKMVTTVDELKKHQVDLHGGTVDELKKHQVDLHGGSDFMCRIIKKAEIEEGGLCDVC